MLCVTASAQFRLSGIVTSSTDSSVVRECTVYLNGKHISLTDSNGKFIFENLPGGNHTLYFASLDFTHHTRDVTISDKDAHIAIELEPRNQLLGEVTVTDQSNFGFTKMRAVENMGIYEGKKSEVIVPDQMMANLATNNARQIYSRVAGLNIWENDGAGLQLSIGGRGLDPNRTSNFNTRQNGYDISADALGYPESYYTSATEGVERIEIVRGAASLQYGTQFGGLVNFVMKKPVSDRKLQLVARQSMGSFGFYNSFTSASGTIRKVSYYTFFQYKTGDGWRANSDFDNHTLYANVNYAVSEKTKLGIDITHMNYLAQQPGGLSDEMFNENPRQSNRERNWFKVNWNLFALHIDHKLSTSSEFNVRVFGLSAYRYAVGFRPNRVAIIDDNGERDLIKGDFRNWGIEARFLNRYHLGKMASALLVGTRYYHGFNHSTQGLGSTGKGADFNYINEREYVTLDYRFPNRNASVFAENVIYAGEKFSVTPGIRFEYINTTATGYYGTIFKDLAGNIVDISRTEEDRNSARQFLLLGLGVSYKPSSRIDIYSNISQNYRSMTFNDMRMANQSLTIDPNLKDEEGYSFDFGIRSDQTRHFNYDVSVFHLNYENRIGEVEYNEGRKRANIGRAVIEGVEAYGEMDMIRFFNPAMEVWDGIIFTNVAFINSVYKSSESPGVAGNTLEFVPDLNLKTGLRLRYKTINASFLYSYLSSQFTDASNAVNSNASAVFGIVPAYSVMDLGFSYRIKKIKIEATVNNLANRMYFTRRATGYPGPGILPSDGRSYYLTVEVKI